MNKHLAVAALILTGGLTTYANTITPSFNSFGSFPPATFGGSGIPNDAVAITKILTTSGDSIALCLTATARYSNPTVSNDGAGTFSAGAGSNDGLTSPGHSIGPTWNFDWYIGLTDRSQTYYQFNLVYQDITTGQQGTYTFGPYSNVSGTAQDSWNLSMGFLSGIGFNPSAGDVYGFQLNALGVYGNIIASSAINVDVTGSNDRTVPDVSSTAGLLGLGVVGLMIFRRQQLRHAVVRK